MVLIWEWLERPIDFLFGNTHPRGWLLPDRNFSLRKYLLKYLIFIHRNFTVWLMIDFMFGTRQRSYAAEKPAKYQNDPCGIPDIKWTSNIKAIADSASISLYWANYGKKNMLAVEK